MCGMRILLGLISGVVLVAAAGCSALPGSTATAIWTVSPQSSVSPESTSIDVLVTRLGCNDGVTGDVNAPDISVREDEIVVTFTVSPGPPMAANCQGNDEVAATIELPEPLGDRALVDGACSTAEAASTVFCDTDVRVEP